MKMGRVLSLALAGSVAVAPSARAVPTAGETVDYCLQYLSFTACASAAITVSGSTLTAVVTNTSNSMGNVLVGKLSAFGFFYLPAVVGGGTVSLTGENHADTWVDGQGTDLSNPLQSSQGGNWLGGANGDTGNDFLAPGESATFTFSISGTPDWTKVGFAWRGQGIDEEEYGFGSIKCYGYEGAVSEPSPGLCEPPTVVPEPATMALLATGLVGMGGATLLRRRRQKQDA